MRRAFDGVEVLFLPSAGEHPDRVLAAPQRGRRRRRGRRGAGRLHVVRRRRAGLRVHVRPRPLPHRGAHPRLGRRLARSCATRSTSSTCRSSPSAEGVIQRPRGRRALRRGRARRHRRRRGRGAARRPQHEGRAYEVTGREAITIGRGGGDPDAPHGPRGPLRRGDDRGGAGVTPGPAAPRHWEIEGWVTTYTSIAAGELDVVSDTVARVAGHEPMNLERAAGGPARELGPPPQRLSRLPRHLMHA